MNKNLKLMREKGRQVSEGKAFHIEERASTNAQRHEMFGSFEREQEIKAVIKGNQGWD